jgi:integrase
MTKRRDRGEGSVFEIKSGPHAGKWRGYVPDPARKGKRISFRGTEKEVKRKVKAALRDIEDGKPLGPGKVTLASYLDTWLKNDIIPTKEQGTITGYSGNIRNHIKPVLGHILLKELTYDHVQEWINARAKIRSPRTVQYMRDVLRAALNDARRRGLVQQNVAELVRVPKQTKEDINPWSKEETRTFLEAIKGHRLYALYLVCVALGPRRGEVLGLRWQDVDFQRGTISIMHSLERARSGLRLKETKTKGSKRTIILPKLIASALRAHRARQLEERMRAGSNWIGDEWNTVFATDLGRPIEPDNMGRAFDSLQRKVPVPRIRFHDLRHTAATTMLTNGVHVKTVSEMLGHSSIRITLDTYGHVLIGQKQEVADSLDRLFGTL